MTQPEIDTTTLHDQLTDDSKSTVRRYQDLALGTTSYAYLIKFELIMLFSSWVPGALGLFLRKFLYPLVLGSVGRNVVFGQGVNIRHGQKIVIGDNVIIDDLAVLDAKGEQNTGIRIGDNTVVSRNVVLSCKNGDISVGANCTIGINSILHSMLGSDVEIGDYCLIGAYCYFIGSGPYRGDDLDKPFKQQGVVPQGGIVVGNNVWFGSSVQTFDGVKIGDGCIVGANTVVNKNVDTESVVAGVPMKVLKNRRD